MTQDEIDLIKYGKRSEQSNAAGRAMDNPDNALAPATPSPAAPRPTPEVDAVVDTPIMGNTATQHKWEKLQELARRLERELAEARTELSDLSHLCALIMAQKEAAIEQTARKCADAGAYRRPECPFQYCSTPEVCKRENECQNRQ